jgi:serine/threonine protein kinase
MDVDKLQTTPLCKSSKKIRKPDAKIPICATPINESDTVSHFQPLISSDLMFGRYVLLKHIADGTFGRVYDAVDKYTGRLYALKVNFFDFFVIFKKLKKIVKATKNCVENAKVIR